MPTRQSCCERATTMIKSKTCQGCGIKFKPNSSKKQRYCSKSCWYASAEIRQTMLDRWRNPEFRALMIKVASEVMLEYWRNNPEHRALISEMTREGWRNNPEFRALMGEILKAARKQWQQRNDRG